MALRDEDTLHPIAPVLRVRPPRPIQVPHRTRATFPSPAGAPPLERRRWIRRRKGAPLEATPETYDQAGHVHPAHPEPGADHLDEEA